MSSNDRESKSGAARDENSVTQPRSEHPVFNNTSVLTESWYPALRSRDLGAGQTASFLLLNQRLVLFRDEAGNVRALDAFCPHLGADLVHGKVDGDGIRCYFHRWKFGPDGSLTDIPCSKTLPRGARLASYPVTEKFGLIWVFAGPLATHEIPAPPGLENDEVDWIFIRRCTLFAHHHVMMANGLDTQHFSAVHGLDIDFEFEVQQTNPYVFDWVLRGDLPANGWRARFAKWLLGSQIGYRVRIAGGSVAAITYGDGARFRGYGFKLPSLHVFWGCVPLKSGVSEVRIFLVMKKQRGLFGWIRKWSQAIVTLGLLTILKDDDVKAFPNMRFNTGALIPADASVAKLVQMLNRMPISPWTQREHVVPKRRLPHAGTQAEP